MRAEKVGVGAVKGTLLATAEVMLGSLIEGKPLMPPMVLLRKK